MPADQMRCPNCLAVGLVEGVAEEVVPDQIKCGYCQQLFAYEPNVWDHIRNDYDGEVGAFYLRVTCEPDVRVSDNQDGSFDMQVAEGPPMIELKDAPTRSLLDAYRQARQGNGVPDDAPIFVHANGRCGRHFTGAEVKAELAKRPHVPNKREARDIRRAKAQGKA